MKKDEMRIFIETLVVGIIFLIALTVTAPCCFGAEVDTEDLSADWDTDYTRQDFLARNNLNAEEVVFVTPDTVTTEKLVTRTPETLIVEELVGEVLGFKWNEELGYFEEHKHDGVLLNTKDDYYNYICYEDYYLGNDEYLPFTEGEIVVTYLVFDRYGHGEDDFERADEYVIDTNQLIEG